MIKIVISVLLVFLLISGCEPDLNYLTVRNPKIYKALQAKNNIYAGEVLSLCRQEAIAKAEIYVDSLISSETFFRLSDSIIFPEKPIKPDFPGPIIITDTIKARPVFK